jgi:hypothetical protein
MGRTIKKIFLFSFFLSIFVVPVLVVAQTNISISSAIPGMGTVTSSTPPGQFVKGFYDFALMIGGVLAFGAIVYGGVLYAASAGNPSKQSEGKEWVKSALLGLLLLGGAYLILYTINPDLVNLNLPTLTTINIQAPSSGLCSTCGNLVINPSDVTESADYAASRLKQAGIGISSTGNCSDQGNKTCTSLQGIKKDTIDELVEIKADCSRCDMTVTGGTETGHSVAQNGVDHQDGYKVDVAATQSLTQFVENTPSEFQPDGARGSDPRYVDRSTGAIWVYEISKNHWDITVP